MLVLSAAAASRAASSGVTATSTNGSRSESGADPNRPPLPSPECPSTATTNARSTIVSAIPTPVAASLEPARMPTRSPGARTRAKSGSARWTGARTRPGGTEGRPVLLRTTPVTSGVPAGTATAVRRPTTASSALGAPFGAREAPIRTIRTSAAVSVVPGESSRAATATATVGGVGGLNAPGASAAAAARQPAAIATRDRQASAPHRRRSRVDVPRTIGGSRRVRRPSEVVGIRTRPVDRNVWGGRALAHRLRWRGTRRGRLWLARGRPADPPGPRSDGSRCARAGVSCSRCARAGASCSNRSCRSHPGSSRRCRPTSPAARRTSRTSWCASPCGRSPSP